MTQPIIDWKTRNDTECRTAWQALKQKYSNMDLLYAFYGGLLSGDIKFEGSIIGLHKHFEDFGSIDFAFKQANEVEETSIRYFPKVPVSVLREIVRNHSFTEQEKRAHEGLFSEEDLNYTHTEFLLSCKAD
jgi:hypothetical protein